MSEFLGEARVLIRPDTTGFRVELEKEIRKATAKPIVVPVTAAVATSGGVTAQREIADATNATRAAALAAGAESEKATAASRRLTSAQILQASAARKLALAEAEVANAASAVGAAQVTATRSAAALTAAQRAVDAALLTQDVALRKTTADTLRLAEAQNLAATSALSNARAQVTQASALGAVRQGAIAQSAALAGLRGSVVGAQGAFIAGVASVIAFGKALQVAAQLETELNVFRVTAGATADEMERVAEQAKALGRDLTLPGVTATDAAQTFLQLARAGLTVQDSLAGARGVLQLAVAAEISFADATQITASALNAFALEGEKAIDVADLLTNAANSSQASISDMGIALRQSAAIADLAGFSLSETVTFLTQLARAGLAGSDAGTSFRVSIQRLIAPTDKAREVLQGLNVNLRDAQGNLRPEAFFELGEALQRMGRAQGDAARQTIFGNDASRAAAFFARINAEAFREQEVALRKQGAAAEVAGARNEGFAGKVENLKNQTTALGIELGELALPVVGVAAQGLAILFGELASSIGDMRKNIGGFDEDVKKLRIFFGESLEKGGFIDGVRKADTAVNDFLDDLDRITGTDDFLNFLGLSGNEADKATPKIKRLADTEQQLGRDVSRTSDAVEEQRFALALLAEQAASTATAISRLQGQEKGLEEQTTRARIAGDEGAELDTLRSQRELLERELAAQEAIIARAGTSGDATAREAIRQRILPQLESVNSEINNIIRGQATESERLADDAARAASERDRNLLDALSGRRDDAERKISAAAETEGIRDDIRRQNQLQALIKQQIQKVRDLISEEKTRKAAIRELRIALIASRAEEDALRAQQREDAAARREEGISLDIAFAETTENVSREIAGRQRLIALLKKQQKEVKRGTNEWKRLRNEIAEQQQAIKDARDQAKDNNDSGKTAQQFFFEQLQAQQGFASNLLGNLIPQDQTAGLVGLPSPTTGPGAGIQVAASVQEGKQRGGPTAGQASATNDILLRILQQLKELNGDQKNPEAARQRRGSHASMDYGSGGGQSAVM